MSEILKGSFLTDKKGRKMEIVDAEARAKAEENAAAIGELSEGKAYQQYVTGADGKAKWEDRLAYTDTVETVILPETTGVINNDGEYAQFDIALSMSVQAGDVVLVNYNGETYECTAYDDYGSIRLGDTDLVKYPFFVTLFSEDFNSGNFDVSPDTNPTGTEITLSLTKKETIVKPIPAEYLPSWDAVIWCDTGLFEAQDSAGIDGISLKGMTVQQIYDAMMAGKCPRIAVYNNAEYGEYYKGVYTVTNVTFGNTDPILLYIEFVAYGFKGWHFNIEQTDTGDVCTATIIKELGVS